MPPPVASVFGSSTARPEDPCCRDAFALGGALASRGWIVKCGGYCGVMEAVSHGAREAGGQVIGVVTAGLNRVRAPNRYLSETRVEADLFDRLRSLLRGSDACFAMADGGPGTLNEVALVWALRAVGEIDVMPLILVGESWGPVVDFFAERFGADWRARERTIVVKTVAEAMDRLADDAGPAL